MRVNLKTVPLSGANVTRELRERVKARFDHEGIASPPPAA
jgi:small conductance mechanosensitive channel